MKNIINTILLSLFVNCIYAQNQSFEWAKSISGPQGIQASCITTDNQGNTYTAGYFTGIVDFDPGVGVYNLTSGGYTDVFICKLNSYGNFVWAKHFGGYSSFAKGISVDINGNVFTTGTFSGLVDFDPGIGVYNLQTSNFNNAVFISKLDSMGNFVWAKQIGPIQITSYSSTLDNNGNVLITGNFSSTVDFDPGVGTYSLTPSSNSYSIFILKLNNNGNFVWAQKIDGYQCTGRCIRTDNLGNVYTTGDCAGAAFVYKCDFNGNYIWAKQIDGASAGFGLVIDGTGNVYSTGNFLGIRDFDPNDSTVYYLAAVGGVDVYVWKLNSYGEFLWAKSIGGNGTEASTGISLDASGNVYTVGYFTSTVDFDPSMGVYNIQYISPNGWPNSFISCLNSNGNFVSADAIGENPMGNAEIISSAIALDNQGNIYTSGYFRGTWDFDQGPSVYNLTSPGAGNPYITYINKMSYPKTLNLKLFLQGYYISSNQMTTVLMNQGVGNSATITDSITIELHSANPPYELVTSVNAILNSDGTVSCAIHANSGNYYLVIKHRNGIETWSATPITIGTTTTYDFTTASSKAYGSNMKQMPTGQWAFYNGDLNQDDNIDLLDVPILETGISNFLFGYFNADLNGDGNVDLLDIPILEDDVNNFVFSNHP